MSYDMNSKFDIAQHKAKYIHYLEVIILDDGTVEYAVPSHQEYLIRFACRKFMWTREELMRKVPEEYYFDMITWLCSVTGCVAIWYEGCMYHNINTLQRSKIVLLRRAGIYDGTIPNITEKEAVRILP